MVEIDFLDIQSFTGLQIDQTWMIISSNDQKWPLWAITIDSEKFEKKISKNFRILGVVTDFQIENFHGSGTWRHFLWLDSSIWGLQFEPYE